MTESRSKRRKQSARRWHRYLGLVAAFPLLWLAVSGIALNHAASLGLHDKMVTSAWVLRHYNQVPEGVPSGFRVGDRFVTEWGGELFLDEKTLLLGGKLVGVTAYRGLLVIATSEKIATFDGSDEMLLELDELSLPAVPVEGVGVIEGRLSLMAGGDFYCLSEDFFTAEKVEDTFAVTSASELGFEEKERLARAVRRRRGMPFSRVILDAHSGSLFGWPGWVIMDLAAVGLVILTFLGLRIYPKRRS